MSFTLQGCAHTGSDCKAPPPRTSCGVSVLPEDTQTCVCIGKNCRAEGQNGPGGRVDGCAGVHWLVWDLSGNCLGISSYS